MTRATLAPFLSILFLSLAPHVGAQDLSAKLWSSRPTGSGLFGGALDIDGNRLIVGASEAGPNLLPIGVAFVYERQAGSWSEAVRLTAPSPEAFDQFGIAVSISGDHAVVGEPGDNELGPDAGSVHVYDRTPSGWVHTAKLMAANGLPGDRFGDAVSISGTRVLVGAQHASDAGQDSGAAYVFELAGASWVQVARLTATDAEPFDRFGVSVDLDGQVAIVGSDGDDDVAPSAGAAFVFERTSRGWLGAGKFTAPDGGPIHAFGSSVAVSGTTAVAGSPVGGAAYVYERGTGGWSLAQVLTSGTALNYFGTSVALSENRLLVGSGGAGASNEAQAQAHVFERTSGIWDAAAVLSADPVPYGSAGSRVAVSRCTFVLGNPFEATSRQLGGAAYVFEGCPRNP